MKKLLIIAFCFSFIFFNALAQAPLILFDKQHPTAKVLYEGTHNMKRPSVKDYPITGNYSPTSYANEPLGIAPNRGYCDYVYIPTEGKLEPGKQYTLKLSIKFDESYNDMTFYQDHFGIALTSYLYPNKFPSHWGLWRHTNESLGVFQGGELITIEKEFRPLCTSKYIVLGVFRADEMDHLSCFFCIRN